MSIQVKKLPLPFQMLAYFARRPMVDGPLLAAVACVAALGLAVLYSASGSDTASVVKQSIRLAAGFTALLVLARIPPQQLRLWTPMLYCVGLVLLLVVAFLGEGRGAQRWLDLGVVRFQPAELLKLTVPMMLAWYLHGRALPPSLRDLAVCLILVAVPAVLIARQPDLGTALLVGSSGLFVLFLAGLSWRLVAGLGAAALALTPVLWHFMHDYQRSRVMMMFNPEADPLGRGWNIIQSKIAVGSGGLYGKGWLNGTQAHLEFLPERSTDFILAVYAEEFGLLGVVLLFALYFYIVSRCLGIAMQAKDTYSRLLAGTLSLTFFVYVIVNSGMISGLLPVVGVPLPLVSYGGTSLVSLLAAFGMIMSVHSHRRFLKER
ncbi:MAG: rod shape-determining protein RodA [Xanthomonadales bacterium]|nr:rod shape-determining protein RodA [Xanthomonadales bacterium]